MSNRSLSSRARRLGVLAIVVLAFIVGYRLRGHRAPAPAGEHADHAPAAAAATAPERKVEFWTCAMHPQIHLPDPGHCPICGMELIPSYADTGKAPESEARGPRLVMSPAAKELADIQTTPVERRFVDKTVRLPGKVTYDETRLGYITTRFPGRIDELYVDYTGVTVRQGDHLAELYSPDLISAQEELFQAQAAYQRLKDSDLAVMRDTAESTVEAARSKLRLWDLTPQQIADIEAAGKVQEEMTIYSPMSGVVIHRNATEGMYVDTGTRIYTIARLDLVWVQLDAYESDIPWLRYGQDVQFTTGSYPGETFHGRIAFIDPVLDPKTRTVPVRVNVPNPDGRLKPDMFVSAVVDSTVAAGGKVIDESLAGKWISPMHPEIIRDKPGLCPICGMPLVRPEDLGFMTSATGGEPPLVIPASAPLITGKRAVVYVEVPHADRPTYEGREVMLGPRAGDWYLVRSGLAAGERVVTEGNFKIDSALQIKAKPSMMSPEGGVPQTGHAGHAGMSMPQKGMDMSEGDQGPPAMDMPASQPASMPADMSASAPASAPASQPMPHDHRH